MSLVRTVKLRVPAGSAKPGPAIGQALGPLGVNMAEFCKQFNATTEPIYKKDVPLSVHLHAMSDRSFKFDVKTPPTSYLIRQVVGMTKGPSAPTIRNPSATISPEAIYEIAKIKQSDGGDVISESSLQSICRSIIGTARSMGIIVKEVEEEEEKQK